MGNHCCGHGHHHDHKGSTKNLGLAFALNFGFSILEFAGGILCNSVAILSDAIHDLGDSLAILFAWILDRVSQKERTEKYSYGWKRFSLLGAIINGVLLLVGSTIILWYSVPRLFNPEPTESLWMIGFALLGVAVNGYAVLKTQMGKTLNERVINLHLLEDALGWGLVLVGAIIMYFTHWYWIDAALGIILAVYVILHAFSLLKSSAGIFLQEMPEGVSSEKIENEIKKLKEVKDVHDFHAWSLDGDKNVASIHIVLNEKVCCDMKKIAMLKPQIRKIFAEGHISHVTLEFEGEGESCGLENC